VSFDALQSINAYRPLYVQVPIRSEAEPFAFQKFSPRPTCADHSHRDRNAFFDLLAPGDERKHGAVEFVGRFPPNGMSHFRHCYKLSTLDAIRDSAHKGRRRI
jgi:hypothetical protein